MARRATRPPPSWPPTCCGRPPSARPASSPARRCSCPSTGWTRCGAGTTASTPSPSPTGAPDLAWDQFQLPFDHQDAAGALPDSVTHSEILYNFVKPPIHGWALRQLRAALADLTDGRAAPRLPAAGALDDVLAHRPARPRPATWPHYQHGNDSGWDNATTFDPDRVVETADLAAFLVLQMRELADLAAELGRADAAAALDRRGRPDARRRCWTSCGPATGSSPAARGSGRTWASASLLDLMPIVLGERTARRDPRRAGRADPRTPDRRTGWPPSCPRRRTTRPTATGAARSGRPSTVLIEDGLRRAGYAELADEISRRFRALCEKSGFAENFDALTGAGLRDRAYTWTASAYLILAAARERRRARD